MKQILLSVATFAFSFMLFGCVSDNIASNATGLIKDILNPPTDQEIYNQKMEEWLSVKIKEIEQDLNQNVPIYADGKIERIESSKINKVCTLLETLPEQQSSAFNSDKNNMSNNSHIVGSIVETLNDFNLTLSHMDSIFFKYSNEFDNTSIGIGGYRLSKYCESIGIEDQECRSGKHVTRESLAIPRILKQRILSSNEYFNKYYSTLNKSISSFAEISSQIKEYSINYEYKLFVEKAQSTCPNVNRLGPEGNIPLWSSLTYSGFRPNENTIYDLNNFKVLQSFNGGILLTPKYLMNSNNYPSIYVNTSDLYTDQYLFKSGEGLVCLSGMKEYTSILGSRKRVHAFKMIPKGKTKYYFLNIQ